jgi:hypothetical protein
LHSRWPFAETCVSDTSAALIVERNMRSTSAVTLRFCSRPLRPPVVR